MIRKIKITRTWEYVIIDFNGEGTVRQFYERELQKKNQNEFRIEKVYISNGKVMIIQLIVLFIKKIFLHKMSYFPESVNGKYEIKVKLDLSNYATKSDLKTATGADPSKCA